MQHYRTTELVLKVIKNWKKNSTDLRLLMAFIDKDPSVVRGGSIEKAAGSAALKGARCWRNCIAPIDLSAESGENGESGESGESGDIFLIFNNTAFNGCYKLFGHCAHFPLAFWCYPSCRLEHCSEAQCVSGKVVLAFSASAPQEDRA